MLSIYDFFENSSRTYPLYNVYKTEDSYVLEVACTGFNREELEVTLDRGVLRVSAEVGPSTQRYLVHQITHKSFSKTWTIPEGMTIGDVTLNNGVLAIKILGVPKSTVRRFEVM